MKGALANDDDDDDDDLLFVPRLLVQYLVVSVRFLRGPG